MRSRSEAQAVLRQLRADAGSLTPTGPASRPPSRVLEWLVGEVPLGGTTLETGCGWSTVALGLVAARHVAIAPDPAEHERIRAWCAEHGVALDGVELVAARSELHLPTGAAGAPESVDVVLVDGDHAFPIPAIDAHHAAPLLRVDGLLVLERAGVRAVADVVRSLRRDAAHWARRHRVDDAVVFQKLAPTPRPVPWWEQPGNDEAPTLEARARTARAHLRARARRLPTGGRA